MWHTISQPVIELVPAAVEMQSSNHYTSKEVLTKIFLKESSVTQLHLTFRDPMDCSTPGFPVNHQIPETAQTHVYRVCDAIQPSHPLLSPSPPALNLSQH